MEQLNNSDYGLWSLVILNSLVFLIFAFSFAKPQTKTDWRTFGGFSAFIIALFTEMYGFPLTIYLFSGWLGDRIPQLRVISHDSGHLWHSLFGLKGNPHFNIFHIASNLFIFGGFILLAKSWNVLYKAQKLQRLATTGPYAVIRHPQYAGFVLIMFGFLLQWPTLPTLVLFPIMVVVYSRLAFQEEKEMVQIFGKTYEEYSHHTPRIFPNFGSKKTPTKPDQPLQVH